MSDAPIPPAAFVGAGVNDALNSSITRADTAVTRRSRLNWPPSSDRIGILPYSLGKLRLLRMKVIHILGLGMPGFWHVSVKRGVDE